MPKDGKCRIGLHRHPDLLNRPETGQMRVVRFRRREDRAAQRLDWPGRDLERRVKAPIRDLRLN